jgi:hypothetical protein
MEFVVDAEPAAQWWAQTRKFYQMGFVVPFLYVVASAFFVMLLLSSRAGIIY